MDSIDCAAIARTWLKQFSAAAAGSDESALGALLVDESHWRNILGLGWSFTTVSGRAEIARGLCDRWTSTQCTGLSLIHI